MESNIQVKLCQLVLATCYYSSWSLVSAIAALNLALPTSPQFLSSVVLHKDTNLYVQIIVTLVSSTFQAYLLMVYAQAATLCLGTVMLFTFTMSSIAGNSNGATSNDNRPGVTYERIGLGPEISRYRCLQLITEEFNGLFQTFHLITHAAAIAFTVICVFGSMRTEGIMAAVQAYVGAWILLSYLQLINGYGIIHSGSRAFLRTCRAASSDGFTINAGGRAAYKIARRELKSLRELRIKAGGSTFYFDKHLVLTVVGVVVSQTVSLLLLR